MSGEIIEVTAEWVIDNLVPVPFRADLEVIQTIEAAIVGDDETGLIEAIADCYKALQILEKRVSVVERNQQILHRRLGMVEADCWRAINGFPQFHNPPAPSLPKSDSLGKFVETFILVLLSLGTVGGLMFLTQQPQFLVQQTSRGTNEN